MSDRGGAKPRSDREERQDTRSPAQDSRRAWEMAKPKVAHARRKVPTEGRQDTKGEPSAKVTYSRKGGRTEGHPRMLRESKERKA